MTNQPRNLPLRSELDIPSTTAAVTDSSHQATDLIIAPAAVCPGVVTRQSHSLFKDSTDQNAVPVRIEKAGLRYMSSMAAGVVFVGVVVIVQCNDY